jgi:hypothetical protein
MPRSAKNQKPPAALAEGGLIAAQFKNLIRQASLPARKMGPLIRIAGAIIALG